MTEGHARPDPVLQLLGATIRQYRQQRGLTQKTLAAKVGLDRVYISQIELGKRNISIRALLHIAAVLETSVSMLLMPLEKHPELYTPSME